MINLNEPYDVYVATEVGNISNGGVSQWVDDWVKNVASHLIVKPILIIEVEQGEGWVNYVKQFVDVIHRPGSSWEYEYTMSQLPIANYFSLPDRRAVDMIIKGARKFHLLSYPLPIMMYGNAKDWSTEKMRKIYKRKIDSVSNRIIFFDGNEDHYSSTCTDQPVRMNINFNWLTPYADNNKVPK